MCPNAEIEESISETQDWKDYSFHSPPTLILQSLAPASTVLPSSTNNSSITPATVEGTGIEVCKNNNIEGS